MPSVWRVAPEGINFPAPFTICLWALEGSLVLDKAAGPRVAEAWKRPRDTEQIWHAFKGGSGSCGNRTRLLQLDWAGR